MPKKRIERKGKDLVRGKELFAVRTNSIKKDASRRRIVLAFELISVCSPFEIKE